MGAAGDDQILMKVAVFGIAMSVMCTALIGMFFLQTANGDYDYDEVQAYRSELVSFSGETMLSQTPWVLTHVYTPWDNSMEIEGHVDADGWMFGEEITDYAYLGKAANIHLDSTQTSSVKLSTGDETVSYTTANGTTISWLTSNTAIQTLIGSALGLVGVDITNYETHTANTWSYEGYRYTFDPTLPFSEDEGTKTSTKDGTLSIVWYKNNAGTGLSGGLDIYGGDVKLASYSSTDIILDYNVANAYATTYDFVFDGVTLQLSVQFDPDVYATGKSLENMWNDGDWSMAISSVSAGNFFDLDNSTSFTMTAGSMIDTFVQIYTFSVPSIDNDWMDMVLWLLVGLPMTMAMLCITLRLVNGFRVL